jgi:hypothetical protein
MMVDGGELAGIGRTPEVLSVLEGYGDPAMEFVWRHKGALAATAALTAFLAAPEPFINGARDLTEVATANTVKPLAEAPGIFAREGATEIARHTNWTLVFLAPVAALLFLALAAFRRRRNARFP